MKRLWYLLIIFVLLMQVNVKAEEKCSTSEMERLKYLASKVELNYEVEWKKAKFENGKTYRYPSFIVTATNLNKDLKVMIEKNYLKNDYREFIDNGNGMGSLKDFSGGENVNVTIRAYTNNGCMGNLIALKKIELPILNIFYYNETCKEYSDFKYCAEFLDKRISNGEFIKELKKYLSNEEKDNSKDITVTPIRHKIEWWYIAIGLITSFTLVIAIKIIVKKNKERL